jgi:class 3 adenylate cyclase
VESSDQPVRTARRVRTVVFTDVVGSTGLLGRIGDDRWAVLWAELDELVGALTQRFDGQVFKSLGDGHMIAFADAHAAVSFSCALQRKLMGRGTFGTPVTLRVGMHTGDVIQTGNDVHGRTVHIAARIAALARPRDILCSPAVRDAIQADGQWTFDPPQTVMLQGVDQPHDLAALRWHVGETKRPRSTPRCRGNTSGARATPVS